MLWLRVLSRTNLANRSLYSSPKSRPFNLLQPLGSLFPTPALCFQQLAASFPKTPGVGVSPNSVTLCLCGNPDLSPLAKGCKSTDTATLTTFRINTCKSVSKQRTLTSFRMNTYKKTGEGGPSRALPTTHRPLLTLSIFATQTASGTCAT